MLCIRKTQKPLLLLTTFFLFTNCREKVVENDPIITTLEISYENIELNRTDFFENVYSQDNLESQFFEINPERDTLLFGNQGTKIKIFANSFLAVNGIIEGNVIIELKEAFKKSDYIRGNLTTHFDGTLLETAGMIYLNATANGVATIIRHDGVVGVMMPNAEIDEEMNVYRGLDFGVTVGWYEPVLVQNAAFKEKERLTKAIKFKTISKNAPEKPLKWNELGHEERSKRSNWIAWSPREIGDTLIHDTILFDTTFVFDTTNFDVRFTIIEDIYLDTVRLAEKDNNLFIQDVIKEKWYGGYSKDYQSDYIFSLEHLGWVNIAKPYEGHFIAQPSLHVRIENAYAFDYIHTALIFADKEICLNGARNFDGFYSFKYGSREEIVLFEGDQVTLLATAYKDGNSYAGFKHFKIKSNQNISCRLEQISFEDLKQVLEENL